MVSLVRVCHRLPGEGLLLLIEEVQRLVSDATFAMDWGLLSTVRATDSLGASARRLGLGCAVTVDLEATATALI